MTRCRASASSCSRDPTVSTTPRRPSTRLGDQAEFVWHTRTDLDGIDGVILPGRIRPRRLPATRRARSFLTGDGRGGAFRRGRRPGARHLQRIPGPGGGRAAARRVAEEPRPDVPLSTDDARRLLDVVGPDARRDASVKNWSCRSIISPVPTPVTTRRTTNSCANGQIVLRYKDNPNGSRDDIAGVANVAGNVVGSDAASRARDVDAARQRRRSGALRELPRREGPRRPSSRIEARLSTP